MACKEKKKSESWKFIRLLAQKILPLPTVVVELFSCEVAETPGGSWASLENGRLNTPLHRPFEARCFQVYPEKTRLLNIESLMVKGRWRFVDKMALLWEDRDVSKPRGATSFHLEQTFWKVLPSMGICTTEK